MLKYVTMDEPKPSINVRELRERKKLSRRRVAVALDVADSTVVRWETGAVKPHLPLDKVQAMLDLFECDFTTLYAAFKQTALESQATEDRSEKKEGSLTVAV
jgi:transcriptional regulator with XRE-family HTH domain